MGHAHDLRAEADAEGIENAEEISEAIKSDYRRAALDEPTKALLDACVRLKQAPWKSSAEDVENLRRHGFGDEAIHDAFQVAAYFNYINRICDGLGVDLEEFMPKQPQGWVRER